MTPKFQHILERSLYPGILMLVALAALAPSWLSGQVPLSVDHIYTLPPWSEQAPTDLTVAGAESSRLQALQYYPWYAFLSRTVERGDSLLWNPLEGCGVPFMALWKSRCFSPFTLPFYVFSLPTALVVSALLKLLVAGMCAFYAARRFGMAPPFALVAALAYQLSGHVWGRVDAPTSDVMPWLPLMFLFVEQIVAGHWAVWPFGCLAWTLMLFGGDPATAFTGAVAALVYLIARASLARSAPGVAAGGAMVLLLSLVVGTALASIQILPYAELLYEALSLGHEPGRGALHWSLLLALLFGSASSPGLSHAALLPSLVYIGFLPVVFVPLWAVARRYSALYLRQRIDGMLLTALLMSVIGLMVMALPDSLPVLRALRMEHFLMVNVLAMGMLSAAAAQQWLLLTAPQVTHALPRYLAAQLAVFAGIVVLLIAAAVAGSAGAVPTWTGLFLALLVWIGTITLLGVTLLRPSAHLLGLGLAAIAAVGLLTAAPAYTTYSDPARLFPRTPDIDAIDATDGRIAGSSSLEEWPLAGNGIPQFYSSSGVVLKRHQLFSTQLNGGKPLLVRRVGTPWLLLSGEDTLGPFSGIRPALKRHDAFQDGVALFEDMEAQPHAQVWYVGRVAPTVEPSLLDSSLPPLMETTVAPAQPAGDGAVVQLSPSSGNVYRRYTVETARPGVFVMADAWYPGWKVRVDDEEKELFPVDVLFRGVAIGAGPHTIEVFYDPVTVEMGMGLSTTASLVVGAGLLFPLLSRVRRNQKRASLQPRSLD